ncbi:MAG: hypothetical protein ACEPOW_00740 [Bacteroidales bacterium]
MDFLKSIKNKIFFNAIILAIISLFFFSLESKLSYMNIGNKINMVFIIICQTIIQYRFIKVDLVETNKAPKNFQQAFFASSLIVIIGVILASLYETYSLFLSKTPFEKKLISNLVIILISLIINFIVLNKKWQKK